MSPAMSPSLLHVIISYGKFGNETPITQHAHAQLRDSPLTASDLTAQLGGLVHTCSAVAWGISLESNPLVANTVRKQAFQCVAAGLG